MLPLLCLGHPKLILRASYITILDDGRNRWLGRSGLGSPSNRHGACADPPRAQIRPAAVAGGRSITPSLKVDMYARILMLAVSVLLAANTAAAQATKAAKLSWGPAPPFLPAGAKFALVSGDPGKAGPYAIQLDMPNGYTIPPHWHPTDEHVTVKTGHFRYGMGDKMEAKAPKSLRPGQSVNLKANMRHYAQAQGRTLVTVSGIGPFAITYVNGTDDPRNKKP